MNILRVILATLVIFSTGAVSGYFIGKKEGLQSNVNASSESSRHGRSSTPPMERGRRSMMDRMQNDLTLSDEQRETISKIFADSRERSRKLWQEIKQPMDDEVARVHEEIKAVLSPEQSQKFDEINERRREWKKKNEQRPEEQKQKPSTGDQCFIPSLPLHQCSL